MNRISRLAAIFVASLPMTVASLEAALGQKLLAFSRVRCDGDVTVDRTDLLVKPFEARAAKVDNRTVDWKCKGREMTPVNCPKKTGKVLIDRAQGGDTVSIICLKR